MPRPKGSKNKPKSSKINNIIESIISEFQSFNISAEDLSIKYKKGSQPFMDTDLIELFEKFRPELEKRQVRISRGQSAGTMRPLNETELITALAEKIAEELGKVGSVGKLIQSLKSQAKDNPLKF